MSATFAPFGLRPVRLLGSGIPGKLTAIPGGIASGYAHDIAKFDAVKLLTDGTFAFSAAGDPIDGVMSNVQYKVAGTTPRNHNYWASGTVSTNANTLLEIYEDPNILYAIQANGSVAQTAVGDCADLVAGTTNAATFWSQSYLGSLVGAGNSAQLRIIGLYEETGNAWGDTYTKVLVKINERGGFGAIGNAV